LTAMAINSFPLVFRRWTLADVHRRTDTGVLTLSEPKV